MSVAEKSPIRTERLLSDLENLARFGYEGEDGGMNRPSFSPAYRQAADWLVERMREAGMAVAMGNAADSVKDVIAWR